MDARTPHLRPSDWPQAGPIDLDRHDLPHGSSLTEWWYANAHLETVDGRSLSVFAAFFRVIIGRDAVTNEAQYGHFLTWALSDLDAKAYYSDTLVDGQSPRLGLERLVRAEEGNEQGAAKDPRVRRAMREMLERGQVPYPDHVFEGTPYCGDKRLELEFDNNRFEKLDDGRSPAGASACATRASPTCFLCDSQRAWAAA